MVNTIVWSRLFSNKDWFIERIETVEDKELHVFWTLEERKADKMICMRLSDLLCLKKGPNIYYHFAEHYLGWPISFKLYNDPKYSDYYSYYIPRSIAADIYLFYSNMKDKVEFYLEQREDSVYISKEINPELRDFSNSITLSKDCCRFGGYNGVEVYDGPYIISNVLKSRNYKKSEYDLVISVWSKLIDYEINFGLTQDWICSGFTLPWYYYKSLKPGETKKIDILCLRI